MNETLQRLTSGYLNDDLSPEDAEALRSLLASDPEALSEFVEAIDLHAELRKILREGKGRAVALKEIRQAGRPRLRLLAGGIAAAAALLIAGFFFFARTEPIVRVDSLSGQVRGADESPLAAGDAIRAGHGVETLSDGRATLRFADGTTLQLGPRTVIRELTRGVDTRVVLTRGTLSADVKPQPADRPLIFATPHGEARVLGTALKLAVDGSTRLDVTHGRVRLSRGAVGDSVEVDAGHFAVVAADRAPESRLSASERVRRMPPNSWLSLPGTRLRQAVTAAKVKGDVRGVIDSWSGGVLDTRRNRLVVWGGGHTNYHGNEVYAFDLESLRWERLTEPTPDPVLGRQVQADGTPIARATYNGLAYVEHADRMFALGGDSAGSSVLPDLTWTFDFATNAWRDPKPSGDLPKTWVGCTAAYDPETRRVWWGEAGNDRAGLYSYDVDANRWSKHSSELFYYQTSAVDTRRGSLVCVGDRKIFGYDLRSGASPVRQMWQTSGGDAFLARMNPGWDYDAAVDRFVGWSGGAVHVLNPQTKAWRSHDAPGAPAATINGIFGRWRYVPSLDVFVVVTDLDENVHFYKLPAGE